METANPILGNPLLLAAILLFLAILPRALRQKEKTELDRAIERFEKEESETAADEESDENDTKHGKPVPPKDPSVAYLMKDLPTPRETHEENEVIPFPAQEEREKQVKIVKEGVPISHNKGEDPPPAPKKKVKLIKQEISIPPDENRVSPKKASPEPLKGKKNKPLTKEQKPTLDEESESSWVEAEIPGLIIDSPLAEEIFGSIPAFKASPKAKLQSKPEKSHKSPQKEKEGGKVKNIAPKSEEKEDSKKPKKQVQIKPDSPQLEIEISESRPKAVEIKPPVVSHKKIAKKGAGKKKAKPFLLNLKYLDQEESEAIDPVSHDKLPGDMVDVVIARLNALQVNLENQLVSLTGELIPRENPINGNIQTDDLLDLFRGFALGILD